MTSEFTIAVHALVFLNHKQTSQSSEAIAENVCTHPVRIRKVLSKLKKADLVITKEGLNGGYLFHCNASKTTLRDVCLALKEEPVEGKWDSGDADMECLIASGMANVMHNVYAMMNEVCYQELARITIADIDRKIFQRGKNSEKV